MAEPTPTPDTVITDSAAIARAAVAAGKAFYKSKTFWFNVLVIGGHYLGLLPASVAPYLPYLLGGANIALRAVTSEPIKNPLA